MNTKLIVLALLGLDTSALRLDFQTDAGQEFAELDATAEADTTSTV